MKDLTPQEAARWLDAAPQIVQDAVTSDHTSEVIERLGEKYKLHVDVTDLLMRLTVYMLVGYVKPDQFSEELRSHGIPDQQMQEIVNEVNQQIFIPLREELRKGGESKSMTAPAPQAAPKTPPPLYIPPKPNPVSPPPPSPQVVSAPRADLAAAIEKAQSGPSVPPAPPRPQPPTPKPVIEAIRSAPVNPPAPQAPLGATAARPYTADPYREPVDEK